MANLEVFRSLDRYVKLSRGGPLFVTTKNKDLLGTVNKTVRNHPHISRLSFPSESVLREKHGLLREAQFETERGVLQIISIPADLFNQSLNGSINPEIQQSVSDAFARRIGIIEDEE